MKVAVIGSRGLIVKDLGKYLPPDITEIVSGGARGIDTELSILKIEKTAGASPCPTVK